jgi:hypothetical protein
MRPALGTFPAATDYVTHSCNLLLQPAATAGCSRVPAVLLMCVDYATFQDGVLVRRDTRKAGKTLEMRSLQRLYDHLKIFLTLDLRD